jgi:hypothetical protein
MANGKGEDVRRKQDEERLTPGVLKARSAHRKDLQGNQRSSKISSKNRIVKQYFQIIK